MSEDPAIFAFAVTLLGAMFVMLIFWVPIAATALVIAATIASVLLILFAS